MFWVFVCGIVFLVGLLYLYRAAITGINYYEVATGDDDTDFLKRTMTFSLIIVILSVIIFSYGLYKEFDELFKEEKSTEEVVEMEK